MMGIVKFIIAVVIIKIMFAVVVGLFCEASIALKGIKKQGAGNASASMAGTIGHMHDNGWIDDALFEEAMRMNEQAQRDFVRQQQEMLNQAQQQEFMRWQQEQAFEAQRMATGMEFGGYNPDPNLNPGMDFGQRFDDFGGANDFGGFNDFGGMGW